MEDNNLIQSQIDEIENLKGLNHKDPKFREWHRRTELYLKKLYGEQSDAYKDFSFLNFVELRIKYQNEPEVGPGDLQAYEENLEEARIILQSAIEEKKLFTKDDLKNDNKIRRQILQTIYEKWKDNPHDITFTTDLLKATGVADNAVQRNLDYLDQKGYLNIVGHTTAGFTGAKITDKGVDLFQDPEEFNQKFPLTVQQNNYNVSGNNGDTIIGDSNTINSNLTQVFREIKKEIDDRQPVDRDEVLNMTSQLETELASKKPNAKKVVDLWGKIKIKSSWINEKILEHPAIAQIIAGILTKQLG